MSNEKSSKVFGGTLIVAGTSIGGGMLAMPITTGLFGFFGTIIILFFCWLFMYWTATLILEASMHFEEETSFLTMAKKTLGKTGTVITCISFLLFFYALIAAYLSASGAILFEAIGGFSGLDLPAWLDIIPILITFCPLIYFGLSIVDQINRYLMIAMLFAYTAIIILMAPSLQTTKLFYTNFDFSLLSFSVVVTSFGFHATIPSLVTYLDKDAKSVKKCLFYGSLIPLVAYIFWELVTLSVLPISGEYGLASGFKHEISLGTLLQKNLHNNFIAILARIFSIFAIMTSFLGVAQGLFDFIKDGVKIQNGKIKKRLSFVLTFLPPVLFIIFMQKGFIALLEYAGAMVSIILGIIPILVVLRLRELYKSKKIYRAYGGRISLLFGLLFFSFVVLLVILKNFSIISFPVDNLI